MKYNELIITYDTIFLISYATIVKYINYFSETIIITTLDTL